MTFGLGALRIAIIAVVALGAVTLAQQSAGAASDLVYQGPFDVGGSIRLTLSSDHGAIASFQLIDVPFVTGCGSYVASASAYYDPPLPVVDGTFEVRVGYGDPHHNHGYAVRGNATSASHIQGTAQASSFDVSSCQSSSGELAWNAEGPVREDPHAGDLKYEGTLAGGQIVAFMSSDRSQLTGVRIEGAQMPCVDSLLDLDVLFTPPLELRQPGNDFLGVVDAYLGEQRERTDVDITATSPTPSMIGGFVDSGISCGQGHVNVLWSAMLVKEPPPSGTPSTPNRLPSTGQSNVSDVSAASLLLFALLGSGALFASVGLGLRLRHR